MKISTLLWLPAFLVDASLASSNRLFAPKLGSGHVQRTNLQPRQQAYAPSPSPSFTFDELFQLQKQFLDNFIFPANNVQARSINSSLLAEDVQGRVDITRTFDGRELNTEYLFGLFSNLAQSNNSFTLLGVPTAYEVTHFAASQNIASASTRFNFTFPGVGGLSIPIQIDTWNVFNAQKQISQYDATFKWWDWTVDYLLQTVASATKLNASQVETWAAQKLAASICSAAQTYCNGTNVQYNSTDACLNFLANEIRFGEAYELGRNTLLCRMVHQNMVPFRPTVHCPHIGPSGGGYCDDDKTYEETVTENYFTNFPFSYQGHASE